MTQTENETVFGLPVHGDIQYYSTSPAEQYPLEQLQPFWQAVLDDPAVESFGWSQYTPYFNDGDACVFHTYGVWVKPVGAKPDSEIEDEDDYYYENEKYEVRTYTWRDEPVSPQHHQDLANAIEGGHYNVALLKAFGDPANVKVSRTGIVVEYFDHD